MSPRFFIGVGILVVLLALTVASHLVMEGPGDLSGPAPEHGLKVAPGDRAPALVLSDGRSLESFLAENAATGECSTLLIAPATTAGSSALDALGAQWPDDLLVVRPSTSLEGLTGGPVAPVGAGEWIRGLGNPVLPEFILVDTEGVVRDVHLASPYLFRLTAEELLPILRETCSLGAASRAHGFY